MFSSHTGQHQKLVPVPLAQSILYTLLSNHFCVNGHFLHYFILETIFLSAINNVVGLFVYQAVVE